MSTPFRLRVPRQLLDEILSQAKGELPNECCGLLAGLIDSSPSSDPVDSVDCARVGTVVWRHPLVNQAASPKEYESAPESLFEAFRHMQKHGLELLGIYHSHPTSAPIPSRKDLESNFYGDRVVHFIVSLAGPEPLIRGWWLSADAHREAEWEIIEGSGPSGT